MTYLQNQIENLIRIAQEEESYEPYHEVLQSITFDKTQMFWLPVKPAPDVKIDTTFKSDNTSETQCLYGGRINASGSNRKMFAFWECVGGSSSTSGYMRADYGNSSTASNDIGLSSTLTDFRNFVKDGADNYIDGVKKASNTGTLEEDDTNTYIALGCMSNGTETNYTLSNPFAGDVAQLKIWKTGIQIADYVPALDSQLRPCLYDKVTKTFLYAKKLSDGTTTYDLGFKRWNKYDVDCIEGTGTQYIDTGYAFKDDFSWELDFSDLTGTSCTLFGGRTSSARTALLYKNLDTVLSGEITCPIATYNGSQTPFTTGLYSNSGRHKVKMSVANNKATVWVDDEIKHNNVSFTGTYISGTTQALFGDNFGGTTGVTELANAKVYGLTMWQGTQIVRDYKPVVWHNSDTTAVACLYDEVYNKMYQNAGTGSFKAYIENTLGEPYEVGMYVQTLKTSNTSNAGYVIALNEYPQDGMGYHIKTTTTSDNSNYLFGSRKTTSGNLQIATLSGSSTNGTILSTVTGTSITWKSNNTDWKRAGTTTYECSIQTYKDGNTYKFNAIGYNYTLGKEADRQTATYSSIDGQQDIPMLYFGAFNTLNILYGDNSHYFVEWNLPDIRHTLLPVINSAQTQFCFIDNKTKEIYEFTKVGAPAPLSNNVKFKQLDGTIITGTLT